ncbi:MAG: hypothetical protein K1X48_03900 [Burkholderiaceae bacterium]|nr:hypothetical protein [Burkholderiaceae bacterium]
MQFPSTPLTSKFKTYIFLAWMAVVIVGCIPLLYSSHPFWYSIILLACPLFFESKSSYSEKISFKKHGFDLVLIALLINGFLWAELSGINAFLHDSFIHSELRLSIVLAVLLIYMLGGALAIRANKFFWLPKLQTQ